MLFLKSSLCFFTPPCLSKDFTQEFSDASWTNSYLLTSGLPNKILSFFFFELVSCLGGVTTLGCPLQFLSWFPVLVAMQWKEAFSESGSLGVWKFRKHVTQGFWQGGLWDIWLHLYCNVKLCWTEGFPGGYLPSQEGGKSIFSLLAWLTRTISMKRLTQIESIHSNQRDCSDGVSPILPARAVCQCS